MASAGTILTCLVTAKSIGFARRGSCYWSFFHRDTSYNKEFYDLNQIIWPRFRLFVPLIMHVIHFSPSMKVSSKTSATAVTQIILCSNV